MQNILLKEASFELIASDRRAALCCPDIHFQMDTLLVRHSQMTFQHHRSASVCSVFCTAAIAATQLFHMGMRNPLQLHLAKSRQIELKSHLQF